MKNPLPATCEIPFGKSLDNVSRLEYPVAYNAGRRAYTDHGEAGEALAPYASHVRVHWLIGFYDARTAARVKCMPDPGEACVDECGR